MWGWLVSHQRNSKSASGRHMTAIMGRPGWPDFVLSHPTRGITLFREVKVKRGKPTPDQLAWIETLRASGLDADIWEFPRDWHDAVALLSNGRAEVTLPPRARA